jgi:cation diffusion facilitator family transporter
MTSSSPSSTSSTFVLYAALAGNVAVAIVKFAAAMFTGSSAMLSEGFHSLVDSTNEVLLLYGEHRARKPPDEGHPLGHGRELYFWCFVVAMLIFGLGAGVSIYEGVTRVFDPQPVEDEMVNYIVLGAAAVFEGVSWFFAMRAFRRSHGESGVFETARRSKNPTIFMVLFEDSAALIGLLIAFLGTFGATHLGVPELDGAASIGIGLVLAAVAAFLSRESKGLLIGEGASRSVIESIRKIVLAQPHVVHINDFYSVHLGPEQILVAIALDFTDEVTVGELERDVQSIEDEIRRRHPAVVAVFLKPQAHAATGAIAAATP